ncbi:hypothetical protein LZ017_18545 [Pelomonas sp. CA6]|uniref:hypothetical protein n=1 Tax=Pelomonas sp. CA6 TaxID=2907999 RepID=UPI001F4C003A|nr:hypothetical protein [Pelomonas sp. CA6]MCH7345382.1 hypothetical protein [Pelomonas sp. CA6]
MPSIGRTRSQHWIPFVLTREALGRVFALLQDSDDLRTVKDLLGHADVATTMI